MQLHDKIKYGVIVILVILITICVVTKIFAGRSVDDKVIIALISAMIAIYTFID